MKNGSSSLLVVLKNSKHPRNYPLIIPEHYYLLDPLQRYIPVTTRSLEYY